MQSEGLTASLTRTHPQPCSQKLRDFGRRAQHLRFHSPVAVVSFGGGEEDIHLLLTDISQRHKESVCIPLSVQSAGQSVLAVMNDLSRWLQTDWAPHAVARLRRPRRTAARHRRARYLKCVTCRHLTYYHMIKVTHCGTASLFASENQDGDLRPSSVPSRFGLDQRIWRGNFHPGKKKSLQEAPVSAQIAQLAVSDGLNTPIYEDFMCVHAEATPQRHLL